MADEALPASKLPRHNTTATSSSSFASSQQNSNLFFDEPGYNTSSVIVEFLKCNICLETLNLPVECKSCHKAFCFSCDATWRQLNPSCPVCKTYSYTAPLIYVRRLLDELGYP